MPVDLPFLQIEKAPYVTSALTRLPPDCLSNNEVQGCSLLCQYLKRKKTWGTIIPISTAGFCTLLGTQSHGNGFAI